MNDPQGSTNLAGGAIKYPEHPLLNEPLLVRIPQAAWLLHTSKRNIMDKLREGTLVAVKDGSRTLVTMESIKAFVASLPQAKFTPLPKRGDGG